MPLRYDLHAHSVYSDGTLTPAELVQRAARADVAVLALTDHDSTDGLTEAGNAAAPLGVQLVPGVEVSVSWRGQTVHIVGLQVDAAHAGMQHGLRGLREFRQWRAAEIARRLEQKGIADALAGARALCRGPSLGRTHFARYLVQAGHARSVREVFRKYLVRGRPGYVPGEWATLEQALGWIHAAGGQAVIAHPARYKLSGTQLDELFRCFKENGGIGVEVVSGSHGPEDTRRMAGAAARFGLLASAGSDYHGPEDPWMELGRLPPLPVSCTPIWQTWAQARPLPASSAL